jgi:Zn-dependent protease/predicted transcriptional regulator
MFSGGFRMGRIFGIDIRIDWSWLFIFVLVTWNLATVFGQVHTSWGATLTWGIAVVAALLFFASVLAHELAHSLVARAQGVPVRSITLFLFGGVSSIERDPSSARNEFVMAFVGPLTSIVIGIALLFIAGAGAGPITASITDPTQTIASLSPLTTLLMWLGSVNVFVGLFNLVPGFPLDGGRVVRSILWAVTGNLRNATRWASALGQLIAWLMILAGIAMVFGVQIPFFGTGLGGLWLAFIGWFLNSASAQSYRQLVIHDILEGVAVSRMMRSDPPTVAPNASISSLVHDHIMGHDDRAFPVMEDGTLVGLVTLEDVGRTSKETWDTAMVREIMTPADRLVTVRPEEDAAKALEKLAERDVGQLPVMQDHQLLGLLRRRDVVNWLQLHSELNLGRKN